jgi:predicted exporter
VKLPSSVELGDVRELAEIAFVDHALRILDAVVRFEHPTLNEPHPADPASLRAARRVLAASCSLRRELRRYRIAALDALDIEQDELPF